MGVAHAENEHWLYDIVSAPTTKFLGNSVDIYPVGVQLLDELCLLGETPMSSSIRLLYQGPLVHSSPLRISQNTKYWVEQLRQSVSPVVESVLCCMMESSRTEPNKGDWQILVEAKYVGHITLLFASPANG